MYAIIKLFIFKNHESWRNMASFPFLERKNFFPHVQSMNKNRQAHSWFESFTANWKIMNKWFWRVVQLLVLEPCRISSQHYRMHGVFALGAISELRGFPDMDNLKNHPLEWIKHFSEEEKKRNEKSYPASQNLALIQKCGFGRSLTLRQGKGG